MAQLFQNFLSGTLTNTISAAATSFESTTLSDMVAVSGDTMTVILDPLGVSGDPEVVTVTAHTAASDTATITRAQESTTAREHGAGTAWVGSSVTKGLLDAFPAANVTGTFSSLTASGDLTVDTDTLYVDSTNNRVGIGTTSPTAGLEIVGSAGAAALHLKQTDTTPDADSYLSAGGTTGSLFLHADTADAVADSSIFLQVDGVTRMRVNGAAPLVSGAGFEWTTWTPQLYQGGDVSSTNNESYYYQLGDIVHAYFVITSTGAGTASNRVDIQDLPVTAASAGGIHGGGQVSDVGQVWSGVMIGITTTSAGLYNHGGSTSGFGVDLLMTIASGDIFRGWVTYRAA